MLDGCPCCGDPRVDVLGVLGTLLHCRCRACGMTFAETHTDPSEQDLQRCTTCGDELPPHSTASCASCARLITR